MHIQSNAWKRLAWLYRQLLRRMRALERAAERGWRQRVFMRVQVEMLQPRVLMSVTPSGVETQVNTTTTEQMMTPAIAMNPAGNSVVVWSTGDSGGQVLGQCYSSGGVAVGGQFQINQNPAGNSALPAVAMDTAGDFAVAWNGNSHSVYVRLYNSSGAPVTGDTRVTSQETGQSPAAIAMTTGGTFVVAWEGGNSPADSDGIYAQQFTAAGLASGSATLINTTTPGSQQNPSIAVDAGGDFAVSWTDHSAGQQIKAAYWPAGGSVSAEVLVGDGGGDNEDNSQVRFNGAGNFVVAFDESGAAQGIYARRYSGSSAIDANPVLVSSANQQQQVNPSIAARADGSYMVAWTSDAGGGSTAGPGNDGNGSGVFAQAFSSSGAPDGSEFQVNTSAQNDQQDAAAAWSGNTAIISWDSNASGSESGIFLQRYATSGAANQPPAIAVPGTQTIIENTPLTFSSANGNVIAVSDSDADGGIEQVALTASSGILTLSGTSGLAFSSGSNGSAAMTITGTLANLSAALSAMIFTPASNSTASAQIQIAANDLGNTGSGGAQSASTSFTVNVHAPPTSNTFPGAQTTVKNTALVFSPQTNNAIYIGSSWDTVQLTATHGTLTLSQKNGLSFSSGNGTNNTTMEFSGSLGAMDAAIGGLSFTPTAGYTEAASIKVVTINSGLLGLGLLGSSSTSNIAITVTATPATVNQAPAISPLGAQTVAEGSSLILSGASALTVSDADAGGAAERLTLSATSGTLTLAGTTGLTFSSGTGTGDASMTFTGTLASINTALASLTFTPAPVFYGNAGVLATLNDLGNTGTGGAKTATATIAINVTQVNQPPSVSVPAAQTAPENGSIAFSSAGGDPITVSDIDDNGGQEQVTLSTPNGTLSLGSMTGLTVNSGGNGQASMAVTGTLADLNAALGTLTFTPTGGFSGTTSVQVAMSDLGNSGAGGAMTASATVSVKVVQTLVVTNASDMVNGDTSSIANLLANPGGDGISLREAIMAIDNTAGGYGINFNISGGGAPTISLVTALPTITNSVVIDGTSQPGYAGSPLIVLDGSGAPANTPGLNLTAGNCVIRGLAIDGFSGYGINVSGVNGATIQSNYIGLDASGAAAGDSGGVLLNNSLTDIIGGPNAAQRNVISANGGDGILVTGTSANVLISGNYIGTDPTGTTALGNGAVGVFFSGTTISTIGHDNVISGNGGIGVEISGGNNDLIVGNRIGTNAAGNAALGNASSGIFLNATTTCTIGKPVAGEQNVISANAGDGIQIFQSTLCTVTSNFIGTDGTGAVALGNSHYGINLTSNAANNTIGGISAGTANVIANNVKGISISGAGSSGNHIVGNSIFSNTSIGIDLNDDGPTVNTGSLGAGANMGMNSPVFTSTVLGAGELTVSGYVGSAPNQSVFAGSTIDIYSASIAGAGPQAVAYIGSLTVDANGNFTGTISVSGLNPGNTITATATDTNNDTSELAAATAPAIAHTPTVSDAATNENQQTSSGLVIMPSVSDNGVTVYFEISNIIGGSLFLNDGVTPVNDGDFITTAEGATGLKFTPAPNSVSAGSFDVQASLLNAEAGLGGSVVTATIAVNATPAVSVNPVALGFTEAQAPVAIDPQLTVSDSDSPQLASATVTLIGYVSGEDVLAFTNQNGITGSWNAITGVLSLSGAASPAQYQAALQSVTYNDTSLNPSTAPRTAEFIVNDGAVDSAPADRPIVVTAVDTPPVISSPGSFTTLRGLPLAISSAEHDAVTVSDVDADGGTEEITITVSHGSLQASFSPNVVFVGPSSGAQLDFLGTLSDLNTALDGLIYTPGPGYVGGDSLSITVNDHGNTGIAGQSITTASIPITVIPDLVVNTTSDISDGDTSCIQNLMENPGGDGRISLREAITALNNTGGRYVIGFDIPGGGAQTIAVTSALPVITQSMTIDGTSQPGYAGSPLIALDGSGAGVGVDGFNVQAIATALMGMAIDGFSGNGIHAINANGLTIQGNVISGNTGDGIDLANSAGGVVDGNVIASNAKGVVISGAGAVGDDLVANSIHDNASIGIDLGDDGVTANTGTENSNLANDGVNSPVITSTVLAGGVLFVTGYVGSAPGQSAFAGANVDLFLADSFASGEGERWLGSITADASGNFSGSLAVSGLTNGDDITATATDVLNNTSEFSASFLLAPAHTPSITNAATNENQQTTSGLILTADPADNRATVFFKISNIAGGSLFLNDGVTPVPENSFITAAQGLAGLKFTPSPNSSATGNFSAQASLLNNDNGLGGSVVMATIAVNAPPIVNASGTPLAYVEAQGSAAIDPQLTVSDSDSPALAGATVRLIGYVAGEDALAFTNQHGIDGVWNSSTGVLTLTGAASPAQYQAALRSVTYTNSSLDPSTGSRSARFVVNDGALDSTPADVTVAVTAVDNAPTISFGGDLHVIENSVLLISRGQGNAISVGDVDAEGAAEEVTLSVSNGTLTIGQNPNLAFANGTGNNSATIDVVGTLADINAALDGMIYTPTNGYSGADSLSITVNDLGNTGVGGPLATTTISQVVVIPLPVPHITADAGLTTDIHVAAPITPADLRAAEDGASADQLTFTLTAAPTQGMLELAGQALSVGGTFTQGDIEQGRLTYAPTATQTNNDSFTFVVTDANGMSLPAATFQIHTTHFVSPPTTDLPDPGITVPAPGPLPAPAPISLPPIDLSIPTGGISAPDPNTQGQGGQTPDAAPSTSTTLDSTSDRNKPAPALAANLGGPFVAPLLPHAPPAKAPNLAAPDVADSPRAENAGLPPIDPPIRSGGVPPLFGPSASGALAPKGTNSILAPGQNGSAKVPTKASPAFNASSPLWRQLDTMQEQVTSERKLHIMAGTASLVSVGISVMYFLWAVRAGSVLSSLLSSMPAWKLVDPLPILDQFASARRRAKREEDGSDEIEDDETLESMVEDERKAA